MKSTLFDWLDHRAAGVLLHPTSLPGPHGVGSFGEQCYRFIDFLAEAGFTYWQLCPLGPTGFGDSPYQSFSSFAGNPYLISLSMPELGQRLGDQELHALEALPHDTVDFGALYGAKWPALRALYASHRETALEPYGKFAAFKKKHAAWLEPYAAFQAIKEHRNGQPWYDWPASLRCYEDAKGNELTKTLAREIDAQMYYQYLFEGQWQSVRRYASEKNIEIIGDIPIFVALDSSDVWQHPEHFQLDRKTFKPLAVAGCPPDYFSEDGQLWGNPLYDWDSLAGDGYSWWIDRLKRSYQLYDVVRIDHFRGFDAYWKIPYGAATAREGKWTKGPGLDFFKAIKRKMKHAKLIAEDLGELTDSVRDLREDSGLPGMAILQFAFGGEEGDNLYLPHNLERNSVIYPGTHDNDTSIGWYQNAGQNERDHVRQYLSIDGSEIAWDLIRCAYFSVSKLAIVALQDLMSLDSHARFNTPGEATGNWAWRFQAHQLQALRGGTADYLRSLAHLTYRTKQAPPSASSPV